MPKPCSICVHPDVKDIEQDYINGVGTSVIGMAYEIWPRTVMLHMKEHAIAANTGTEIFVVNVNDILSIPVQMHARAQLVKKLIELCLVPLFEPPMTTGKGINKRVIPGIDRVQTMFLARLLKIQQTDEQTVLKMTGILKEEPGLALEQTESYLAVKRGIDEYLQRLGTPEQQAQARMTLAEIILPDDEDDDDADLMQPFRYTDLGAL